LWKITACAPSREGASPDPIREPEIRWSEEPMTRQTTILRGARAAACTIATLAAAALAAAPADAGIHYLSVTRTEAEGQEPMTIATEAWIEGESAKVAFTESGSPVAPAGSYMLTRDGGRTVVLVDPEEKTWAEWDLDAMLASLGAILQAMGPMLNLTISNIEVAELAEEPGGTIHGLATTHYRYRTSYDLEVKVIGIRRTNSVEQVQDVWSTDALTDVALGLWLRKAPKTGFENLDELIEAEMSKAHGVPLKMEQVSTTTGEKGKRSSVTRTSMEVTELERAVTIPPATFEIPAGYTQTEMMIPGAAGQPDADEDEKGRNPFRRILGGGGD
jgi:hypothetical protein